MLNYKEIIQEVSDIATKEKTFEKIITKMKYEWKSVKFSIGQHKGYNII